MPPVEAATPDVDPQPSSNAATAEEALPAPNLNNSAAVAVPERINSIESPAPLLEPVVSVEEPTVSFSEPPEKGSEVEVAEVQVPGADTKPDVTSSESTAKPEADPGATSDSEVETDAKQTPSSPQAESQSSRTIAGMRQIVEKRLEAIVTQDKESRDAKWQQNLIQVALEYAWHGKFDTARQVAANPALPLELQMSLLGKIAAIETQFLASQVAQSPDGAIQPPAKQAGQSATNPQGRHVPAGYSATGYSTVSGLSSLSGYAGVFLGNQCPAIESPQVIAPPQASPRPAATSQKTSGVPDFVPALGQNLASRLARLSQTQSTSTAATSVRKPVAASTPLVAPELFVGVAASTVPSQAQANQSGTPSTAAQPKISLPRATPPQGAESKSSEVKVTEAKTPQPQETQPVLAKSAQIGQAQPGRPFAERLFPSQLPAPTQAPTQIVVPSEPVAVAGKADNPDLVNLQNTSSERQVSLPLDDFQPFSFTFSQLLDKPLDWVWNWWNVPTPQAQAEQFSGGLPSRSEPQISVTATLPLTAEVGLANPALLQTIEQDLTMGLRPWRNARKLSISLPSTKNVALKAPLKGPDYSANALLAVSCHQAQLTQSRLTNALINPTTAKQLGWVNFMFPLPIPAVITSAFGWRTHPISGDLRFHTGLDIGAPMGTPVLSATPGRVVVADAMGGYGLTVVVENETTHQRKLYAHLSDIAVQPGTLVEQGAVLGWVGSTGNSTGPHLHFESQIKTEQGWTVIDPLASAAVAQAED